MTFSKFSSKMRQMKVFFFFDKLMRQMKVIKEYLTYETVSSDSSRVSMIGGLLHKLSKDEFSVEVLTNCLATENLSKARASFLQS